jgi:hypothetical protein
MLHLYAVGRAEGSSGISYAAAESFLGRDREDGAWV